MLVRNHARFYSADGKKNALLLPLSEKRESMEILDYLYPFLYYFQPVKAENNIKIQYLII